MYNSNDTNETDFTDLVRSILSRLNKTYTGTTLSRIAVEVGDQKDIKLLLESKTLDWNEAAAEEDPAIMWALKNDKIDLVQLLLSSPGINLEIRDREGWSLLFRAISRGNLGKFYEFKFQNLHFFFLVYRACEEYSDKDKE